MYDEDKLTETRKETSDQQPGLYFNNCHKWASLDCYGRGGYGNCTVGFNTMFDFTSQKGLDEKEHMVSHILERLIECSHYHSS